MIILKQPLQGTRYYFKEKEPEGLCEEALLHASKHVSSK